MRNYSLVQVFILCMLWRETRRNVILNIDFECMVTFYKGILNKTYLYILINGLVWREICSFSGNETFYRTLFCFKLMAPICLIGYCDKSFHLILNLKGWIFNTECWYIESEQWLLNSSTFKSPSFTFDFQSSTISESKIQKKYKIQGAPVQYAEFGCRNMMHEIQMKHLWTPTNIQPITFRPTVTWLRCRKFVSSYCSCVN